MGDESSFILSNVDKHVGETLSKLSSGIDEVHMAVAYVSDVDLIETLLKRNVAVNLVVALQPPTDPGVLRSLVSRYPSALKAKFYSKAFHSKLFVFFKNKTAIFAQVGSSNLTGGGLRTNLETNVILRDTGQLKMLENHFGDIWKQCAELNLDDINSYDAYCDATKKERASLKKIHEEFEARAVLPRIRRVRSNKIAKEARAYVPFWNLVDQVGTLVKDVSRKQWPTIPLYLTMDHFWHWLVKVWDKQDQKQISSDAVFRTKRLPELFAEYALWDKSRENYTNSYLEKNSDFFRRVLSESALPKLSEANARKVYRSLHSGYRRALRFRADVSFVEKNGLPRIREAFGYLLWSKADVSERISALLADGRYHLEELGASGVQELLGWMNPEVMPIRNKKAENALNLLGYMIVYTWFPLIVLGAHAIRVPID